MEKKNIVFFSNPGVVGLNSITFLSAMLIIRPSCVSTHGFTCDVKKDSYLELDQVL